MFAAPPLTLKRTPREGVTLSRDASRDLRYCSEVGQGGRTEKAAPGW